MEMPKNRNFVGVEGDGFVDDEPIFIFYVNDGAFVCAFI